MPLCARLTCLLFVLFAAEHACAKDMEAAKGPHESSHSTIDVTNVEGDCKKMTMNGIDKLPSCLPRLQFIHGSNESSVLFDLGHNGKVLFVGRSSDELEVDEDHTSINVGRLETILARASEKLQSVGVCHYGNPHLGIVGISCHVDTSKGVVDAEFLTNGKEPVEAKR